MDSGNSLFNLLNGGSKLLILQNIQEYSNQTSVYGFERAEFDIIDSQIKSLSSTAHAINCHSTCEIHVNFAQKSLTAENCKTR